MVQYVYVDSGGDSKQGALKQKVDENCLNSVTPT